MRKEKYDEIGKDYDLTRKADPVLTDKLIEHLAPKDDGLYLDIGCGTGNYTNELQKKGLKLIGMDPSDEMLEKAKLRNSNIDWRKGYAENVGLPDNTVDGVIASLTIHHWTDLRTGFSELNRVLKPGGRIVVFTSTPEQMKGYWLNHYFPKMLADSIDQMPDLGSVRKAMKYSKMQITKLDKYFIHPDLQDKFLYCGKHNPELYLDKQIRQGISSFSSLANRLEVDHGLLELIRDIDNKKIKKVMKAYKNKQGDYLYVVGEPLN